VGTVNELGTKVKSATVKALDQNNDGKLDREDATILATSYESRFPLGAIAVAFALGVALVIALIAAL
jgi:hypothetical protein